MTNETHWAAAPESAGGQVGFIQGIDVIENRFARRRFAALASVSVAVMAAAGAAQAQTAVATAAATAADNALAEVVVVAEKRETTIQNAPLAITAVGSDTLDKANITRLDALNGYVPGLTVANAGPEVAAAVIRGVGLETQDNLSSLPGVAFHVDGVNIPFIFDLGVKFLDTQRVEVLRGPQSTVYGQSATGGVINAISYRPTTDKMTGYLEGQYGNYDLRKVEGAFNMPLGDKFAIRIAGERTKRDGYAIETGLPDYRLDDANDYGVKVGLLFQPTDNLSLLVSAQQFQTDTHGSAMKSITDPDPDPRHVTQDFPNKFKLTFNLYTAELRWKTDFATVRLLSGFQTARHIADVDVDRGASPFYYDTSYSFGSRETFTQELNIASPSGGRIEWLVGAYYMNQHPKNEFYEFLGYDAHPRYFIPTSLANIPYNFTYSVVSSFTRVSRAGFAQATVHATPWFRVIGGARYTKESLTGITDTSFLMYSPLTIQRTETGQWTGKLGVEADLSTDNMLYATWSRGFKPGGVNLNNYPILTPLIYKPETISAFEVGSKNRLMDRRLVLNAAAFLYNYNQFQFGMEDPVPYQGGVANIPKARIWGVELEGVLAVSAHGRISANLSHIRGTFRGDFYALDPSLAAQVRTAEGALGYGWYDAPTIAAVTAAARNTNGNQVPKIPDWQGSIAYSDNWDVPGGVFGVRAEYIYRGDYLFRVFNTASLDRVPSYGVVNLSVDYKLANTGLTFAINATNLFDKDGVQGRYSNPFGSWTTDQQYIPPRQVFGSIRYAF